MPETTSQRTGTEDPAVTNFREYLRIKTVHPNPDYDGAIAFLEKMAKELDLPYKLVEVHPGRVVFYMTWVGEDPSLKSILLNSHTDVVPVYPDSWKVDAFSAHKMENGDIYARGTQDMKCVGMQYIEAIRRLKREGRRLKRTIHVTFVPDEEIGGFLGMKLFIETEDFKNMNVGFALDEGLANPTDAYTVFYGERTPWWIHVSCTGNPGHGSRFIENNAAEKLRRIINSFLDFRGQEEKKLKTNGCLRLGDVTTVNLTMLEGGIQMNVVPEELKCGGAPGGKSVPSRLTRDANLDTQSSDISAEEIRESGRSLQSLIVCGKKLDSDRFDIRIPPTVDLVAFEEKVKTWCREAGEGVTYNFAQKNTDQTLTSTDKSDPWWNAFSTACEKMGTPIETEIFPAGTDIRFIRAAGYPALGFSPMNNTPILLHDHNEFLSENVFLRGIEVYCEIIPALASV